MTRIAIIGLGAVTRNIHLPAYSEPGMRVAVVGGCDPDPAARASMEKSGLVPRVFERPEEMIEVTRPDVVSICTPPALHHEQTLMALNYGCHVFCEKPMAESLWQADEMIDAAERAKRVVVINNQFPYMRIHQAAKQCVGSPEFGRLLFLQAWQIFRPTELTEATWRGQMRRRLCFEFGVHVFELVRFFFDETPTKIFAQMPNPKPEIKSDVLNILSMEFADGRAASVILNRLSKAPERYLDMRLDGELASIHTSIGGEVRFEAGIHTKAKRPFLGFHFSKGGKAVLHEGNKARVIAREGLNPFSSATAHHFSNFIDGVEKRGIPLGTAAENRDTLALVFAAYHSAQSGQAVELSRYQQVARRAVTIVAS